MGYGSWRLNFGVRHTRVVFLGINVGVVAEDIDVGESAPSPRYRPTCVVGFLLGLHCLRLVPRTLECVQAGLVSMIAGAPVDIWNEHDIARECIVLFKGALLSGRLAWLELPGSVLVVEADDQVQMVYHVG